MSDEGVAGPSSVAGPASTGWDESNPNDQDSTQPEHLPAPGSLLGTVVALARQVDDVTTTIGAFERLLRERLFTIEEAIANSGRRQADEFAEQWRGVDDGITELRRVGGEVVSSLREMSARAEGIDELRTDLAALTDHVVKGFESLEVADASETDDDAGPAVAELVESVRQTRESIDMQAAAAQASATALAKVMRSVRDLQSASEAQAAATQEVAALLSELTADAAEADVDVDVGSGLAELAALVREVHESVTAQAEVVEASSSAIAKLTRTVGTRPPVSAESEGGGELAAALESFQHDLVAEIQGLRDDLINLKRRIPVRSKDSADRRLAEADITRIVDALTVRLEDTFEVLPDETPPAPPPPTRRPGTRTRRPG